MTFEKVFRSCGVHVLVGAEGITLKKKKKKKLCRCVELEKSEIPELCSVLLISARLAARHANLRPNSLRRLHPNVDAKIWHERRMCLNVE